MRLGIDFGTTRIVIAAADRGNYPIISFECPDGAVRDWIPPVVAVRGQERRYGWDAWLAQQEEGWTLVRSIKRLLPHAGLETQVEIAGQQIPMWQLLREMALEVRRFLSECSSLQVARDEPLEAYIGVPANANSNQRFLTAEAFRLAGFEVLGLLNEPSAASIEFAHRYRKTAQEGKPKRLLIYDLGGGTFDASIVEFDRQTHTVLRSEGIESLGGDDFDWILAELALSKAGLPGYHSFSQAELFRLTEECRQRKESIHPTTRKIVIDLDVVRKGLGTVTVPVEEFYAACEPLLEQTFQLLEELLQQESLVTRAQDRQAGDDLLEAIYVTGGGSELPLVARKLREHYGYRVKRSAHSRTATAIGLAIQADASSNYVLRDRFTRYFGVWREAEGGQRIVFDPLFKKGEQLPAPGEWPLCNSRQYYPVHNIGHFRYLECSRLSESGEPAGDITFWDEIRFPFDPQLREHPDLEGVPICFSAVAANQLIEEAYSCDASGQITVTISNLSSGYSRTFRLARWSGAKQVVRPGNQKVSKRTEALQPER